MDRCPSCRARTNDADHCRRCGMNLELLYKVEEAAEAQLAQALSHLSAGETDAAAAALRRRLSLQRDPLAEQLLEFAEAVPRPPRNKPDSIQPPPPSDAPEALPNAYYPGSGS